jgi:5-methylcytosine-specific restriction endonuclease McrA
MGTDETRILTTKTRSHPVWPPMKIVALPGDTGLASPQQPPSGNVAMNDYVLNQKPEPAANEMVWAFDLGKGSIGEAVRQGTKFLHKASLLIPAELARRGPAKISGTPANRHRALKTREAHYEREHWLERVWRAAKVTSLLTPLRPREVWENPETHKWELKHPADYQLEREFAPAEFRRNSKTGEKEKIVYPNGRAQNDGAPASTSEDFNLCYTSCLLRIKLLNGDSNLKAWQIYKALRAAIQCRGYGIVPWATKEARKQGKSLADLEAEDKKLQQTDHRYQEAVGKWPEFKGNIQKMKLPMFDRMQPRKPDNYYFVPPCYYDASKMGLWNPSTPDKLPPHTNLANSTRNIRFDRIDVRRELIMLGDQAVVLLPEIRDAFARWQREGWKIEHPVTGKELTYPVHAKTFGEFLCDGPAGKPDETSFEAFLNQREKAGLHRGSFEEWMAALGQKTPSFDNRILNDCTLIPRFHVCKVDLKLETAKNGGITGKIISESLLASEVTLLLKLKNLLVSDPVDGQRKLTVEEVRDIFAYAHRQLKALNLIAADGELIKEWPKKVADRFALNKSDWEKIAAEAEFFRKMSTFSLSQGGKNRCLTEVEIYPLQRAAADSKRKLEHELPENLKALFKAAKAEWKKAKVVADDTMLRPLTNHEIVKAPKTSGRSGYSRVALRIIKELILSGQAPSVFHARLLRRESELLGKLGASPAKPLCLFADSTVASEEQRKKEDTENRKRGLLESELNFLLQMRKDGATEDSWKDIFIPSQTLDALQQRHTRGNKLDADAAISELLGSINDPIVRHRLEVFDKRLKKFEFGDEKENIPCFGVPDAIVLEFVREDFMGEKAKRELKDFQDKREAARKKARAKATAAGSEEKSAALKFELAEAQGFICLYCGQPFAPTKLNECRIEHIVPTAQGGPDAMVNYVTAHDECNEAKGKQTPFQWWHHNTSGKAPTISWDGYIALVDKYATTLRNKKVQLLTREDADKLVERYTALAETAWISKLAQAIVNLRFNWSNGYDQNRKKRVIVVSGGLTARVRRKYGLDKLLYNKDTDAEVFAKKLKNRADKRHHALDAMVLTFIPQWARDPGKEGFFRFSAEFGDYEQIRKLFGDSIAKVIPRYLTYERPVLRDRAYGQRDNKTMMVQRTPLRELAYKPVQQKLVYDLTYAADQIKDVRDERIKQELQKFIAASPEEPAWNVFCDRFEKGELESLPGIKVSKVSQNLNGDLSEYKDMSKDGCGAFRRRKERHRGQFVYTDAHGKPRVEVVRVFDSKAKVKAEIEARVEGIKIIGFFQSDCLVKIGKPVVHGAITLAPGTYQLNKIVKEGQGRVQVTSAGGEKSPVISLSKFLEAGFERVD